MEEKHPILKLKEVSKNFGGLRALDKVSLEVSMGSITSLIGPNGAGKTTLFNVVSGIFQAEQGSIFFEGREISRTKVHQIARLGIARTYQNLRPFKNMNVSENVMVSCFYRKRLSLDLFMIPFMGRISTRKRVQEEADELLRHTGLYERRHSRPTDLPYGFQRRLEIARGLALHPKILLLDEPFSGMTPTEVSDLMQLILNLKGRGITILLIEHNMNVVMDISDWIIVLNFGKKISEGIAHHVRNDPLVREAYLGN
jgi:branched-chain amino acid transport system ATP-binding protein